MKLSLWLSGLALAGTTLASRRMKHRRQESQSGSLPPVSEVPEYNISLPVDHFDNSNQQTYSNRYWVNDTYYKPGGPVILYDNGESEFDPISVAEVMAEWNGSTSAALQLADKLNGLVIGWEHRYYGYSLPVAMNETTGVPIQGAAGYKYLTVDQALEDLVYFANSINTTTLNQNSVVQSTAQLDPYHTPWIHMGGSYPGARAAWSRLRNPEVFYSSWASSAPVQAMADGTTYYNPISRALPSNCTNDLAAISAWVDQTLSSGSSQSINTLKAAIYFSQLQNSNVTDPQPAYELSDLDFVTMMYSQNFLGPDYQYFGAGLTLQVFCDYLESFDTVSYLEAIKQVTSDSSIRDIVLVGIDNNGTATPTANGVAASNGQQGSELAFAAFTYATYNFELYTQGWEAGMDSPPFYNTTEASDTNSWSWQTLAELGWFQWTNTSSKFVSSTLLNESWFVVTDTEDDFYTFSTSDFPSAPNPSYEDKFGGWTMRPSNVMFANGEFDPWRAFSVNSQEYGSPGRNPTTTIPQCNTVSSNTDTFGIVYAGAVHAEDMLITTTSSRGSEQDPKPLYQGLDLFVQAYNTWQPCFNQFRDDVRNGKATGLSGSTGSGSGSNNSGSGSSSSGSGSKSGSKNTGARAGVTKTILALALGAAVFASL